MITATAWLLKAQPGCAGEIFLTNQKQLQ